MTQGGAGGAGRSTATVLFTDLVGSTELRSRLGENVADDLRRQHDTLVVGAVETSRGVLVKNLGDGIMATFAGAADAVGAAVAIQQAIARHNRPDTATLEVRIGISAGDVVFEGDDCFGTPVIEAARLCAAARGGQIVASEMVRWLARSGGGTFTPIGNLELKGLPEPVPAVQVDWEPLPESQVPFPPFLTDIGRIFVGRDGELERLGQLWKEVTAGELRIAFLAGEPGVGKTRLAAELARRVHDEGATVLAGRCDEDLGVSYQPFVEALRHFVDHAPVLTGRLGRYGGELVRLVPELAERVPDLPAPLRSDPETERYRLFDAVAAWLVAASGEEPFLLLLDDLQWAAKPTLLLLRHVVRAGGGRVLVLGTYRDTELAHDHPLVDVVADLRRQGGVERLSLSGLDDAGVAAIVEQAAGRTLDEAGIALARAVYEETEGNPFFVKEVLRHLTETGAVEREEGGWTTRLPVDQLGIPEGVREVVGRRLARLSGDANQALRVAAVVGADFELDVVQAAGDLGGEALLAGVEEAIAARVVIEVSATRFRFAHALMRATLYESLTATRKVTLHRKAAEAIETTHEGALDDYLPALAHHWARASAPTADTSRAVDYARRAGDRALAQFANDEAAGYFHEALELLDASGVADDDRRRLGLLISLGEAQRRAGAAAHRETLLAAAGLAQTLGDAEALAQSALANSRGFIPSVAGAVDTDRVAALQAAADALPTEDSPIRARVLATLALELSFHPDPDRRLSLSDEATAMARRLNDPKTLAGVLLPRFTAALRPDTLHLRIADAIEVAGLVPSLNDPALRAGALFLAYRMAVLAGRMKEADTYLEAATALALELGQPTIQWMASILQAGRFLIAGKLEAAEQLNREAAEFARLSGHRDTVSGSDYQLFLIRAEQGQIDERITATLDSMLDQFRILGIRLDCVELSAALAAAHLGRTAEAKAAFRDVSGRAPTIDYYSILHDVTFSQLAVRLGEHEQAERVYRRLQPYPEWIIPFAVFPTSGVSYHLGLLAAFLRRFEDAEVHFAAAAADHERIGAAGYLARTHLEWARMLLTRAKPGDTEQAHDLLHRALATARDRGLTNIEWRAVELLSPQ